MDSKEKWLYLKQCIKVWLILDEPLKCTIKPNWLYALIRNIHNTLSENCISSSNDLQYWSRACFSSKAGKKSKYSSNCIVEGKSKNKTASVADCCQVFSEKCYISLDEGSLDSIRYSFPFSTSLKVTRNITKCQTKQFVDPFQPVSNLISKDQNNALQKTRNSNGRPLHILRVNVWKALHKSI